MQNKQFNFGPVAIPTSAGNLLNPPTATGGVNGGSSAQYILVRHIRVVNRTASAITFSLYKGLTAGSAADTEIMGGTLSVAANSFQDYNPGMLRLDSANFLTGVASGAGLVISGEGEIGVSG